MACVLYYSRDFFYILGENFDDDENEEVQSKMWFSGGLPSPLMHYKNWVDDVIVEFKVDVWWIRGLYFFDL